MLLTTLTVLSAYCSGVAATGNSTRAVSAQWAVPALAGFDSAAEQYFSPYTVGEIHLSFSLAEWNSLLNDYDTNHRNELFREASCVVTGGGLAVPARFTSVGVRLRGNTSRQRPEAGERGAPHSPASALQRVHFKIKFNHDFSRQEDVYGGISQEVPTRAGNKGQALFPEVKALNLKYNKDDPSAIRQALSYEIYRGFGVHAVRTTFTRLYIRIGEENERYLGVYLGFEDIDKSFLKKRFESGKGAMFKNLWQSYGPADLARADYDGDLTVGRIGEERTDPESREEFISGAFIDYRPAYDLKEDPDGDAVERLNVLMELLSGSPTAARLEEFIDVQSFLRAMAVNVMIGQADDYWRGGNNYYLFINPDTGLWTYLPYDNDRTFGIKTFGPATANSSVLDWGSGSVPQVNPVLVKRILEIPEYLSDYKAYLVELERSGLFTEASIERRARAMQDAIAPYTGGYQVGTDDSPFDPDVRSFTRFVGSRLDVMRRECR